MLSAGHGCMLLYSLLHLTGYDLPLDELKRFRQWGSLTPGHPEYGHTPGRRDDHRAARPGHLQRGRDGDRRQASGGRFGAEAGFRVFVIATDGDLMEGVSNEASLPGRPPRRSTT